VAADATPPAGADDALERPVAAADDVPPGHRSGFIAVVGRPNVGKSTLLNALLGEKLAIVSPKPQTTRRRLLGILTRPDAQIVFIDTPGIHQPRDLLGQVMVEAANRAIEDADVVLFIVDVSVMPRAEDAHIGERLREQARLRPVLLALNKADRLKPAHVVAHVEAYASLVPGARWELISAVRGDNLPHLLDALVAELPAGPRYYPPDQLADVQLRDLAGELVREQALLQLEDEIPHGVAVFVDEFREQPGETTYIHAELTVERESHKGVVIGKRGARLRAIGAAARREIERLVGGPVYLELQVKVRTEWRTDSRTLKRLGYSSND
jgi:GTP-binding protein Era